MTISLSKGGNISLAKAAPGMTRAGVGLGWNPRTTAGAPWDLDASALLLNSDGRLGSETDFVFYNNLSGAGGAVRHTGDNRDGEGDGDDELIELDLAQIPGHVQRIVFVASIDEAVARGQNFGQVSEAYIRVFDRDRPHDDSVGARFDLAEDAATETALIFGELRRDAADWTFRAVARGYSSGLAGVLSDFGVQTS